MDANEERLCKKCGKPMIKSPFLNMFGSSYYVCYPCGYKELLDGQELVGKKDLDF